MLPMVEDINDLKQFESIAKKAGVNVYDKTISFGTMVETLGAFNSIQDILSQSWIDFVSIGTNDGTSEIYGLDREDTERGRGRP